MNLGKQFSEYKLDDHLNGALNTLGYENTTPIQEKTLPLVLSGQDVAGLAETGTGKTAAFLLPLVERVLRSGKTTGDEEIDKRGFENWENNHFNLILVPTRELAEQVKDCALDFVNGTDHRVVVVYGGVPIDKQIQQLEKGFTFLVATPGRLIDLYKNHKVDLKQVRSVTFDEADRMFDMGFKDDMKYILHRIPEQRQLLLFSATLNLDVFNVAYEFGANPVEIKVSEDKKTADNVDDKIFHLGRDEKPGHLLGILSRLKPRQVIIFTNFKSHVERVSEFLNKNGHKAVGISSLLSQSQRKRVMDRFREEGGENILVATDVAARGLDIEGVDLVINYELPDDAENYVHRIGRTGRAGEKGKAYSFVSDKDVEALDRIQKYLSRPVDADWMEDNELPKEFEAFPRGELFVKKSRGGRNERPIKSSGGRRGRNDRNDRDRDRKKDDRKKDDRKKYDAKDRKSSKDTRDSKDSQDSSDSKRPDTRPRKIYNKDDKRESKSESKQVHRDKRSGRHKDKKDDNKKTSKKRRNTSSNNQSGQRKYKQKARTGKSNTPSNSAAVASKKGIMGKLTGAIKGLFG